jgi:HEAT repeat protein
MVPMLGLTDLSDECVVGALGSRPRASSAYRLLLSRGQSAVPAIRAGLRHPDSGVREQCCRLLDHLLVADAVEEMIAMLDDPVPAVRVAAVHALSCDRCKKDACRPAGDLVLPPGLRLLRHDPDAHVRAMAAELVGRFAHSSAEAQAALLRARDTDPATAVRKKAGWYAPGGTIHRRTQAAGGSALSAEHPGTS